MKLQQNPFYILKVPCTAGRREIVSASDEMSFVLDSETCVAAQNDLLNPNKRLSAEMGWFIDVNAEKAESIRSYIENGEPIPTDGLPVLSKLNAAVYNLSLSEIKDTGELERSIVGIDELFSSLDVDEVVVDINYCRETAKIAQAQPSDVEAELGKKREEIRQAITEKLSALDQDSYVVLITQLAEKYIADEDYEDGVILDDVLDQYEVRMQSVLEEGAEAVKKQIAEIKNLADSQAFVLANIRELIQRIQNWDRIAQPLQLKSQASGMPHQISERLGSELRALAVYLHNEKGLTKEALTLVNAMRDVFAELGNLAELFKSDAKTLASMLDHHVKEEIAAITLRDFKNESEKLKSPVPTKRKDVKKYLTGLRELNAKIKGMQLDAETKRFIRERLCYIARGVALNCHNIKHETSLALMIAKTLVYEFSDIPALYSQLNEDVGKLKLQMPGKWEWVGKILDFFQSLNQIYPHFGDHLLGLVVLFLIGLVWSILEGGFSSIFSGSNSWSPNSYSSNSYSYSQPYARQSSARENTMSRRPPEVPYNNNRSIRIDGQYRDDNPYTTNNYGLLPKIPNTKSNPPSNIERKQEVQFRANTPLGESVYADIVSIVPETGIYMKRSTNYHHFICKCKTTAGEFFRLYISCAQYLLYFDQSVSTSVDNNQAKTIVYHSPKRTTRNKRPSKQMSKNYRRIHGVVKSSDSVRPGLSYTAGMSLVDFTTADD